MIMEELVPHIQINSEDVSTPPPGYTSKSDGDSNLLCSLTLLQELFTNLMFTSPRQLMAMSSGPTLMHTRNEIVLTANFMMGGRQSP